MDAARTIDGLPGSRGAFPVALLLVLQRNGPLTANDIAARIGMSRTAVLHQLGVLGAAGLVGRRSVRHGVGRPHHVYDVTADAQAFLPSGYGPLAMSLISAAQVVGGRELVARLFDVTRRTKVAALRDRFAAWRSSGMSLADRARTLGQLQDSDGFVADVTEDSGLRLRQRNCPIVAIAIARPEACEAELRTFRDLLFAEVDREASIATGGRECIYRIRARDWDVQQRGWRAHQMRSANLDAPVSTTDGNDPAWDADQMRWPMSGPRTPELESTRLTRPHPAAGEPAAGGEPAVWGEPAAGGEPAPTIGEGAIRDTGDVAGSDRPDARRGPAGRGG